MKHKKKYTRERGQVVKTDVDNRETSKVKVDMGNSKETYDDCNKFVLPPRRIPIKKHFKVKVDMGNSKETYDDCNKLVLPPRRIPIKKHFKVITSKRILSKTQRKKLEKIVEKKKKKVNRALLLEELLKVQAPAEELNQLTSVASIQTKGLKRHFKETQNGDDIFLQLRKDPEKVEINSLSGSKRRKRILAAILSKKPDTIKIDPNILGFDQSESSSDGDENEGTVEETPSETIKIETKENENDKKENYEEKNVENEEIKILETKKTDNKETEKEENVIIKAIKVEPIEKPKSSPAIYIPVDRDHKIQEDRLKLPILAEEQVVMEAINENNVIIIAGETGSGKTTQVPQFLYEAGYARNGKMIGVTQPRRVAAISMSKRIAEEMNLGTDQVSYLIRFEGNVTENTKIKFMTDGVLLKEIQTDFILSKYSVIILDEAHERNVYTDILIGLLSRIVPLRIKRNDPLKLIIMSATLRVEDFTENARLFKIPPPIIKVDARQYPVAVYFNKQTSDNYLKDCFIKTCKIHTKLPEGGILVFLTGQNEVNSLVRKLRKAFPYTKEDENQDLENSSKKILDTIKKNKKKGTNLSQIDINLDKYSVIPNDDTEGDLLEDDLDILNNDFDFSPDILKAATQQPLWVLPLYSLLPSAQQAKVFDPPPEGCRLCVVSTNIAETSLTIPNIKYVVDSGKTKTKLYDKVTGVTSFQITWCSKASANQRAGRAGRVGPGYCYRIYSSAVFNYEFPQFSIPEIKRKPVDDLILQMKSMNIVKVLNFPFPTCPDILQLKFGENRLRILGALEKPTEKDEWSSKLTKLGETMASFPVSPRFAKMLALSCQHDLLQYTVCIVAALSVPELFLNDQGDNKWSMMHGNLRGFENSFLLGDVMVLLRAVGAAEYYRNNLVGFCSRFGLRHKAVLEVRKLRVQLTNQINLNIPELNLVIDPNLSPPTDVQAKLLRQIVLSGMADHVAHKVNLEEIKQDEDKRKWKRAYRDSEMEDPVFMHSSSALNKHMPDWIVYQEVYETNNKLYMRGVTAIEPEWLPVFVPDSCNLSEPLTEPPPRFDEATGRVYCYCNGTFGKAAFTLPTIEIPLINNIISYKWFAVFFLEGKVFPKLRKYAESLLSAPISMTKTWARLQPRTELLLAAFLLKKANTRDQVLIIWKEDPFYLLDAYKSWLPESAHDSVTTIWPPV